MWLQFADARVERGWRSYHSASHARTDLLWCLLLLAFWLTAIGKVIWRDGQAPLLLGAGPALLLITVRHRRCLFADVACTALFGWGRPMARSLDSINVHRSGMAGPALQLTW